MLDKPSVTLHSRQLLRGLPDIVNDLWGTPAPSAAAKPAVSASTKPEFPPFEQIWRIADEAIDWTDALVHTMPTDGLTSPEDWILYRRYAAAVLSGDVNAYADVLRELNPLSDLAAYVAAFHVTVETADNLQVRFSALPALLRGDTGEKRRYLAGMCLRIARDLFSLLPVLQVSVAAVQEEKTLLSVTFDKQELMKVRFSFVDPVTFAEKCGGVFCE